MAHNASNTVIKFPQGRSLEVGGRKVMLRVDGRLEDLNAWSPEVAQAMAVQEGLTLSDDHWLVLNTMREYYKEFNVSPVMKLLKRSLRQRGAAQLTVDQHLDSIFPGGVLVQGSRLAGIPLSHLDVELERTTYCAPPATLQEKAHFVGAFEFNGESYSVTCTGNLLDLHRWNESLAVHMAQREGIELTPDHWEVLNFLRRFYFEYGITPMVKILMKHMHEELGADKASRDHLYQLFPKGPSRQGSRIAGLPEPQGCIDG